MTALIALSTPLAGRRSTTGLVHELAAGRTACGHTPSATWTTVAWTPPGGCCKTCVRLGDGA